MKSPTSQVETRAPLHIPPPDGTHAKPLRVTNSPLLPLPPLLSLHPIHRCPSILCLLASIQVPWAVTNIISRKLTLPFPLLCSHSPSDQQSSRQGVSKTALYLEKSAFVCPAAAYTFDPEELRQVSRPHRLGYAEVGRNSGLLSFFDFRHRPSEESGGASDSWLIYLLVLSQRACPRLYLHLSDNATRGHTPVALSSVLEIRPIVLPFLCAVRCPPSLRLPLSREHSMIGNPFDARRSPRLSIRISGLLCGFELSLAGLTHITGRGT